MLSFVVRSRMSRAAMLFAAAVVTACGGSDEPAGPPPKDVTPATITSDVTGTLTGIAGSALNTALGVTVVNKAGQPIDDAVVTFAVASGGGTVSNATVKTVAGKASTTWTLGPTVGSQTVTATVGTLAPVTFTATATAGAARNIAKLSTDPQTAVAGTNVAVAPSVKVTDVNGNPVAGVLVTFAVASGGGSVVNGLVNTDATGVATLTSWRLGNTAGVNTLTATATGITTPVTFSATGTVGTAASVQITNTAPTLNAGQKFTFTTLVRDANGNTVTNPTVTWSTSAPSVATVTSAGVVTGVGAGSATITATVGTAQATQTINVIGTPGNATSTTVAMNSTIGGVSIVGGTAYVARSTASALGIVDIASGTLTKSTDLGARAVDVAAASNIVAVGTSGPALVWFLTPAGVLLDSLELPANVSKMAMTSNGTKLFVDMNNFNVAIIDVPTRTITTSISIGGTPAAFRMGPGDTLAYLTTRLGSIYEITVATGAIRRRIETGLTAVDMAISPDGKTAFIADGTNTVNVVRLATGGMSDQTITFAGQVQTVGITPDGRELWALWNNGSGRAAIVNGTFDVIQPLGIGPATFTPTALRFDRLGSFAVVVDAAVNQLIILK